ncbi:hypothetical protein BV25DRAFT_315663 [Artomyces pyxidatus]|uniref:Uncharacterized protein n=1 Tax=Artomyces pyxidatus TaxID=48021 RepID=A0ACB8T784_9AGAM|nr:hypothetical protein BV25DRAFT_315663 [Artomyces pyxidatus]
MLVPRTTLLPPRIIGITSRLAAARSHRPSQRSPPPNPTETTRAATRTPSQALLIRLPTPLHPRTPRRRATTSRTRPRHPALSVRPCTQPRGRSQGEPRPLRPVPIAILGHSSSLEMDRTGTTLPMGRWRPRGALGPNTSSRGSWSHPRPRAMYKGAGRMLVALRAWSRRMGITSDSSRRPCASPRALVSGVSEAREVSSGGGPSK